MSTVAYTTLSELQSLNLPLQTRLAITFEDTETALEVLKRQNVIEAMKKLKGSGNGNLVTVLLEERKRDKLI
ncbi:MAG: hypothetical protein AAB296_01655 [Candidatus Desantisbacteria bacterium]